MKFHSYFKSSIYLGVLVALSDQLSKWWLLHSDLVTEPTYRFHVAPFLNLVLVRNRGVTFGMLSGVHNEYMPYILMGVGAIILFFLGRWVMLTTSKTVAMSLGAIMGGAIGNILDRIREGAVVDFLDFYYHDFHWYAFNIADAAIVIGVTFLVLENILRAR